MEKIFAYVRISTNKEKQKTDRQLDALNKYSSDNGFVFDDIIQESVSGSVKTNNRDEYKRLKEILRAGDILIITDLDRLGRDADNTITELKDLKSKGVRVIALDIPHMNEFHKVNDSSIYDMIIDMVITLKAHMAQQEREKTIERINQGLAAARANGKKLGRPKAQLPDNFLKEYKKFVEGKYGDMSATAFARMIGIGRATLYKYINTYNKEC